MAIELTDTFLDQGRRSRMCVQLRNGYGDSKRAIKDENVLAAMGIVQRHWFMDPTHRAVAYDDFAIEIGCQQTISRPSTVAFQSQLLEVRKGMKVLEIGTGSGYQTAVLCTMGAEVYTIERQEGLYQKTRTLLRALHYKAKCYLGDGYKGMVGVDYGPFDRILITCGAPFIPEQLMRQLKTGGIMVIPVGDQQQTMMKIIKNGDTSDQWEKIPYGDFKFVPMLDGRQFR
ncbi:MAG: protein-L-isoaspartate O-methyltransferase [Bacteroidales bacterium]|nr:protein-L-isoaspartate O-methyltransferase [Bacteroidales bacterium]